MSAKQVIFFLTICISTLLICSCEQEPPPPSQYGLYHEKGVNTYLRKDYDSTIYYWNKALEAAKGNKEMQQAAMSLNNIGVVQGRLGRLNESLLSAEKALKIYRELGNDTLLSETLVNLGQVYMPHDKSRSAELLYEGVAILERHNKRSTKLINAYNSLGNVEQNRMAFANAIEHHEKALELAKSLGSSKLGSTLQNLGSDYLEMGEVELALTYLNRSIRVKDSLLASGDNADREKTLYSLGRAHLLNNEFGKAEDYFNAAGSIYREEDNNDQTAYIEIRLAELETQRNQHEVARTHIEKAAPFVYRSDDPELQREYQDARYNHFLATGEYEKAAGLLPELQAIKDRVLNAESQKDMTAMKVRYDVDQLDQTIEVQEKTIRNNRTIIILTVATAVLLAIVVVFIYINYRQADRRRLAEQKAKEQEARQKEQIRQLHEEMYHRVKNNLATFAYILELEGKRYSTDETREALRDQKNRLAAINAIHNKLYMAQDRSNKIALNLKTYLTDLSDQILYSFGYSNLVSIETDMDRLDLDMDRALLLGQLLNESLTNAFKYAVPDNPDPKIAIRLKKIASGEWQMEVCDNGQNTDIDIQNTGNSLGMKIFKNLTKQLKARWHLDTSEGVHHAWVFNP